jgi:hypothetical protein
MQLVKCVATSRSPGCGQRIDDLGMLICGWPMFAAGKRGEIIGASAVLQQLRQLGDVSAIRHASSRVRRCAAPRRSVDPRQRLPAHGEKMLTYKAEQVSARGKR